MKRTESQITLDLENHLTGESCSKLIMEIIKYILYQKQQIPIACDILTKMHAKSKPSDRNFSVMENLLASLSSVTSELTSQFLIGQCDVKYILIIIGPTIASPKLCVKFEVPLNILSSKHHLEYQHSHRKPLLNAMRKLFECSEFQNEMTVPLGPTNTFVLVQKKDPSQISKFFVPKPQFVFPHQNAACFHISLNYSSAIINKCTCERIVKVHKDTSNETEEENSSTMIQIDNSNTNCCYQWYQSREVLKGFKFIR